MDLYRNYMDEETQDSTLAEMENEELDRDYDKDQVDADILDSLLSGEEVVSQELPEEDVQERVVERQEGTTVITKGTTINGSIISDCSLDVMGTITGDIECLGKLSITGKVTGNSTASEVFVNTDRLEGSINSEGCVKIAQQTVVIGDIKAASGVIAGAVRGGIDVSGPIVIDSTAVIQGDINARSIQVNNGAVLDGRVSLANTPGVDIDAVFDTK